MKNIFVILGMHRSGTSVLAHFLHHLGLQLPAHIQPGGSDNPSGHFEPFLITRYNDNILQKMSRSWHTSVPISEKGFEQVLDISEETDHIAELIEKEYGQAQNVLLKDPRMCLLLPLWSKYFNNQQWQPKYIIPLRHPLSVAFSMQERNKLDIEKGLLIWLNHLFSAERMTRDALRTFILFPDWIDSLEKTVSRIEKELHIQFPQTNQQAMLQAAATIDTGMIHHTKAAHQDYNTPLSAFCETVFTTFCKLTNSQQPEIISQLDTMATSFSKMAATYKQIELLSEQRDIFTNEQIEKVQNLESTLSRVAAEKEALQRDNAKLQSRLRQVADQTTIFENKYNQSQLILQHLNSEFEKLYQNYLREQYTVLRPLYKNLYSKTGRMLRSLVPNHYVDRLKKIVPSPEGVKRRLRYPLPERASGHITASVFPALEATSKQADVFVFSIINWKFRHQRPQHIATGLGDAGYRVFYMEMELADGNTFTIEQQQENVFSIRLPSAQIGHIQPYSGRPTEIQLKKWLNEFYLFTDNINGSQHKRVVVQHPFWWQFLRHLSADYHIVVDCMDDISGFSNTAPFLLELEEQMHKHCDALIVTSQYLYDKNLTLKEPVIIKNGGDISHFTHSEEYTIPSFITLRTHDDVIHVGYVGAIADWFDAELIAKVAEDNPHFHFHLCGEVSTENVKELHSFDNISFYGEIGYEDVPAFLFSMDVLTIPFKLLPIIQACDPVKFYEYSAMGKPTVSTPLPELIRATDLAFIAHTSAEFARQLEYACKQAESQDVKNKLIEYATNNSWENRIKAFDKVLTTLPKVSVIILSYGDPSLTLATLESLVHSGGNYPNLEIIVCDNGSERENLQTIYHFSHEYKNIQIIENGENLGFAKGNNVGIKAATGEYVLLLNNDTYVAPGAIHSMVRHLMANPDIGVVGPLTNNIGNEAKIEVEYTDMTQMRRVARLITTGFRHQTTPLPVVAYFAAMFRRDDLQNTFGSLPEEYGLGMFEDDDHCAVIQSKGYICALAEDAFIHHHLSANFDADPQKKQRLMESNKKIYEAKWGQWKPHHYRTHRPEPSIDLSEIG